MGFEPIYDAAAGKLVGHRIACSRGGRSSGGTCAGCKRFADALFLCDFPVLRGGRETTCDLRICFTCKTRIGPDRDLCPKHKPLWDFEAGKPKVALFEVPPLKPVKDPDPEIERSTYPEITPNLGPEQPLTLEAIEAGAAKMRDLAGSLIPIPASHMPDDDDLELPADLEALKEKP